jgi:hypothetical protein
MTHALALGPTAASGPTRLDPRIKEPAPRTPEAEPKEGSISRDAPPGGGFDAALERAVERSDGADDAPEARSDAHDSTDLPPGLSIEEAVADPLPEIGASSLAATVSASDHAETGSSPVANAAVISGDSSGQRGSDGVLRPVKDEPSAQVIRRASAAAPDAGDSPVSGSKRAIGGPSTDDSRPVIVSPRALGTPPGPAPDSVPSTAPAIDDDATAAADRPIPAVAESPESHPESDSWSPVRPIAHAAPDRVRDSNRPAAAAPINSHEQVLHVEATPLAEATAEPRPDDASATASPKPDADRAGMHDQTQRSPGMTDRASPLPAASVAPAPRPSHVFAHNPPPQSAGNAPQNPLAHPASQIVSRGLAAAVAQRGGTVQVRLIPESLGEVRIQMRLDAASVSVKIDTANPAAHGLLTDHLAVLRSSLEATGLNVQRLTVQYTPAAPAPASPGSSLHGGSAEAHAWGGAPQHDAGGSPSRGDSDREPAHGRAAPPRDEAIEDGLRRDAGGFGARLRWRLSAVA